MTDAATVTPAPAFSGVPLPEPTKRGPGRPRTDSVPRAPGRPKASTNIRREVGALLVTINLPLSMFVPSDALDSVEIDALAISIDDQCKRSPAFRGYVLRALKVQSATSLIAVVGMIAARRAARHGLLPDPLGATMDTGLGVALAMMTGAAPGESPPPVAVPVAAEPEPVAIPVWTPPVEPA